MCGEIENGTKRNCKSKPLLELSFTFATDMRICLTSSIDCREAWKSFAGKRVLCLALRMSFRLKYIFTVGGVREMKPMKVILCATAVFAAGISLAGRNIYGVHPDP